MKHGIWTKRVWLLLLFLSIMAGSFGKANVQATEVTGKEGDFRVETGADGTQILEGNYSYQVIPVPEEGTIPAGYAKTSLILYGTKLTAYTLTEDLNSDFLLLYCKNNQGEEGFYQYDKAEKTMQRYTGTITKVSKQGKDISLLSIDEYNEKVVWLSVITGVSCALTALCVILIIRLLLKLRKEDGDFY